MYDLDVNKQDERLRAENSTVQFSTEFDCEVLHTLKFFLSKYTSVSTEFDA
jgi:hypothetical protein